MHTETLFNGNLKRVLSKPVAAYWTPSLDRNNDFVTELIRDFANAADFTNATRQSGGYRFLEKSPKELEEKKLSQMQTKRTLQEFWETRIFDIICLLFTFYRNILRE